MPDHRYLKSERLCSHNLISSLFEKGNVFHIKGYKVVWIRCDQIPASPVQIAFTVPKRSFKKAVDRNLIKRRLRESYRKRKQILYDFLNKREISIAVMVIFQEKQIPDYLSVQRSIKEIIKILEDRTNR